MDFLDILIGSWRLFSGGVKKGIIRTSRCTSAVLGFRGSVGGPGDCNTSAQSIFKTKIVSLQGYFVP